MVHQPTPATLDDRTREQLLAELHELRARNAELKQYKVRAEQLKADLSRAESIAKLGHWCWDMATNKVTWSDWHFQIFGYPVEHGSETFDMFRGRVHPNDVTLVDSAIRESITESKPYYVDYRIIWPDGSIRYIHSEADEPVKDSMGKPILWFGICQDITERKRAEEALRESEERYRGLFESSLDGIATIDMAGNFLDTNLAYQRMLGYSGEELRHLTYQQLTPARWHEMEMGIVQELVIGRGYSDEYEKEYIRKDGTIFPIGIRTWLIKDKQGTNTGMWAIIRDITEHKRAEEALRNSERLYRAIGESIDYGVWVCAPDGRNIYASESFLKLVGLTQDQCSDFGWGDVLHPDDAERTVAAWKECVRTEGKWDIEHRYRGVDDNYHPILARGVPVRDDNGEIICWAGINLDIDRLKHTEEELNKAKAQAELYLDLMSHDINNMHQTGMGYLELALAVLKEKGRIQIDDAELLEKSMQAMQDSTRLIDNVRKLRSAQSPEYQLQSIDLREVLEDIKGQFSDIGDMRVTVNYTPTDGHILATGLVKDVFANLVGNAIKHSDLDKPLEINITQLHVFGTDESYYKVIIEDNGPGIPDELKTRIFDRFERGNTKAMGKGLGLYLVKTLVHGFHGKIWVEDRVQGDYSKGAKFVVILPAVE